MISDIKKFVELSGFLNESRSAASADDTIQIIPLKIRDHRWISMHFQSNNELNTALDGNIKEELVEILISNSCPIDIWGLTSYVQGNIMICVSAENVERTFYDLFDFINKNNIKTAPPLKFNLVLATQLQDGMHLFQMMGSNKMNENFKNIINKVNSK